ncbi:MAG TPA: hypothetical protein VNM90_21915, partial [Haliangium sp.]|nr:hypothetical protein [Haliangium sp.]
PRPAHGADTHSQSDVRTGVAGHGGAAGTDIGAAPGRPGQMISDAELDASEFDIHDADTLILAGRKNAARNPGKARDQRAPAGADLARDRPPPGKLGRDPARTYDPSFHSAPTRILPSLGPDDEPKKKP